MAYVKLECGCKPCPVGGLYKCIKNMPKLLRKDDFIQGTTQMANRVAPNMFSQYKLALLIFKKFNEKFPVKNGLG
jgi:hypothetical protein